MNLIALMMQRITVVGVALTVAFVASPLAHGQAKLDAQLELIDNGASGIGFVHTDGGSGKRYIMESVIGSLALFDYDGDGFTDVYLVNGSALQGSEFDPPPTNRLYRNNGDWTFKDVTEQAGVGDMGYGMGVVVGDFDEDGDPDLFLSNYGVNRLYVNQGDGRFCEGAESIGVRGPFRFGAGNVFFDMDGDGDLDLYCASYVEFEYSQYKVRTIAGHQFHTGPVDYPPAADFLFRNEGDGTFVDVSEESGIAELRAPGMGALSADFDEDGDFDLFVANDQYANFLLINDGQGNFVDDGLIAGVAYDLQGKANGNMGVDYVDLDGDGQLDLLTTTYQAEMPVYYRAVAPGLFVDSTNLAKIDPTLTAHVNWGIGGVDFDNDGDRDLFIACGHFLDNIRFIDDRTDVKVLNYLLANDGKGKFSNVTRSSGSAMQVVESSRAAAFDDLDNDGDVDVVVLNFNAPPTLARNTATHSHNSLSIELVGTRGNRDAVGSRITVIDDAGRTQTQVVMAGRGYESGYGKRLSFGFGTSYAQEVQVLWPNQTLETFNVPSDYSSNSDKPHPVWSIREGSGRSTPHSVAE